MDDLISRKSLLNKINAYVVGSQDKEFICKLIKEMPSAQQWIPCSERLPEVGQTVITSSALGRVREATYKGSYAWEIHGVVHWTDEILSWSPLPNISTQDVLDCQSAQQWIPCSERLPDQEGEYLVTFNDEWRGPKVRTLWYGTPFDIIIDRDKWVFYCDKEYGFETFAPGKLVVAWMQMPKPYKDGHE